MLPVPVLPPQLPPPQVATMIGEQAARIRGPVVPARQREVGWEVQCCVLHGNNRHASPPGAQSDVAEWSVPGWDLGWDLPLGPHSRVAQVTPNCEGFASDLQNCEGFASDLQFAEVAALASAATADAMPALRAERAVASHHRPSAARAARVESLAQLESPRSLETQAAPPLPPGG